MATLRPLPLGSLVRRAFRELGERQAIFDLPLAKSFFGDPDLDLSVRHHGELAASPFGPAAGPHTQLAQNIVLSWLAGGRVIELKTVQVNDRLTIPRPCIDVATVGYNVEWSQELTLEESREEYVKAWMLIAMLRASGRLPLVAAFAPTVFDLSVGYDLAGIQSERVVAFLAGMRDARATIERLRRELPPEHAALADLDFDPQISRTLTLSTFHGCPPQEIEGIVRYLQRTHRLACTVKLNPVLLGPAATNRLLHEVLGYEEIRVPPSAFARDATWEQMLDFVGRLGEAAAAEGLGFGVKFSNTLIVENHRGFFPSSEREMYLSGPPLHVLAATLVARFRRELGDRFPISFAAGVDRGNFADLVAQGLAPVTVCTDLLKPGGYARGRGYLVALAERMRAAGARTIDELVLRTGGSAGAAADSAELPSHLSAARLAATAAYAGAVTGNPRYTASRQSPPRKIGRRLALFDCINCEKCVPVCPNDANFLFALAPGEIPILKVKRLARGWELREDGSLRIAATTQIGNFADFCNDCGNCDVFCPEDGGPYALKPRFFATLAAWEAERPRDGFFVNHHGERLLVRGRIGGHEYRAEVADGAVRYDGEGFHLTFAEADPRATLTGEARGEVDLTPCRLLLLLGRAILAPDAINYVSS